MADIKYLDGVQEIEDSISEFVQVASGTVNVGTNQYPFTQTITKPAKVHRNYILLMNNKSGQTIAQVPVYGSTNGAPNSVIPNTAPGMTVGLKAATPTFSLTTGSRSAIDLTSEEPNPFVAGDVFFQFNLSAAPTSGTIDWALIGY